MRTVFSANLFANGNGGGTTVPLRFCRIFVIEQGGRQNISLAEKIIKFKLQGHDIQFLWRCMQSQEHLGRRIRRGQRICDHFTVKGMNRKHMASAVEREIPDPDNQIAWYCPELECGP